MSQKKKNFNEKSETLCLCGISWAILLQRAISWRNESQVGYGYGYGHFRTLTQSVHSWGEVNVAKIHVCEDKNIMGHKWGRYGHCRTHRSLTPRIPGQYLFEESSPQSKFVWGRERQGMEGKTGSGRRHHRICSTSFNTTILLQYAPFSNNACRPMRFVVIPVYIG